MDPAAEAIQHDVTKAPRGHVTAGLVFSVRNGKITTRKNRRSNIGAPVFEKMCEGSGTPVRSIS
jgi:hypothetical protein